MLTWVIAKPCACSIKSWHDFRRAFHLKRKALLAGWSLAWSESPSPTQMCVYPREFMTLRVAQFSLKIAHLSFSMVLRGPRACGLRPRLWLLIKYMYLSLLCFALTNQSKQLACYLLHQSGDTPRPMGLMHNYVIQCMRVRLGGIAKPVPPFFRECVFHFYILATNIPL